MTLEYIENRIYEIYAFFHLVAPEVTPNPESGELGALWHMFDRLVEQQS